MMLKGLLASVLGARTRSAANRASVQALLEEGVYETTNEDERRALHTAALAYWRGRLGRSS